MKLFISARIAGLVALVVTLLVVPTAAWSKDPVNTTLFGSKAIHGYDPVAYFVDGKPQPGKAEFEFEWKGAKWRFVTAEHRDAFKKAPDKYAPQYGGYCAYAVSQGRLVDIDPSAWSIVEGKLYLNYDLDVQKKRTRTGPPFSSEGGPVSRSGRFRSHPRDHAGEVARKKRGIGPIELHAG